MSLVIERFLSCDDCGDTYGVDHRSSTAKECRTSAKDDGWSFNKGMDYCEDCTERKEGEK